MRLTAMLFAALLAGCAPDAGTVPADGDGSTTTPTDDGSTSPDAAAGVDGGDPADLAGGSGALFSFAVFGDCRPAVVDDPTAWPTTIVSSIFTRAQAMGAQAMLATGDYMNADTQAAVAAQVDLLVAAEKPFVGPIYHAMGNHECMGSSSHNCPLGNESPNIQAFLARLVPSGVTTPYYRVDVPTPLGKAKIVVIAGNAWSDAQGAWLTQQMADPTTYTFVVRHEAIESNKAPGTAPSEAIVQAAPYTLELLAHTHEYLRLDRQRVISGNGGAPLAAGGYGFLMLRQLADGNVAVSEIDQASGQPIDTWKVSPTGQPVP